MVHIETLHDSDLDEGQRHVLKDKLQNLYRASSSGGLDGKKASTASEAPLEPESVLRAQSVFINLFLTALYGVMEYLVIDRFNHPNPLKIDLRNPYFQAWCQKVFIGSWVMLPMVYLTVKVRHVRWLNVVWFTIGSVSAAYMVYIAQATPSLNKYKMLPGLAITWILMTILMDPYLTVVTLVGVIGWFVYLQGK